MLMEKHDPYYPFFVYGTLIPGQENDHLWGNSIVDQQEAQFSGAVLYSFDYFPMLICVDDPCKIVKGMIVTIDQTGYSRILQTVDRLEEFDPADEANSPYRRQAHRVTTANGTACTAWVYVGRPAWVRGRPRIESGDWRTVARQNPFEAWWASNGFRLMSGQNPNSDS